MFPPDPRKGSLFVSALVLLSFYWRLAKDYLCQRAHKWGNAAVRTWDGTVT